MRESDVSLACFEKLVEETNCRRYDEDEPEGHFCEEKGSTIFYQAILWAGLS